MSFQQQPPSSDIITNYDHLPITWLYDPPTLRVPTSWNTTPPQHPFNSDNAEHYRNHPYNNLPRPIYPFPSPAIHSALDKANLCLYTHYIPHSDIDMSDHTIDWPCGCRLPTTKQLSQFVCNILFPHTCHDTPRTLIQHLCPQCRLGHGIRNCSTLTPIAYIYHGDEWYKVKPRMFGEALTRNKAPPKKRSQSGRKTFLTDRKRRRNGRKR